jgi:uncharacterized protein with NAD-binding domain and iron-sulfur cluster
MADHKVLIIGGGISGLSAAHQLVRAGVDDVHVYEASTRVGGKARSQTVPVGAGYPDEHGFRFFPHFYRHIVDTMRSTPVGAGTAWDQLVGASYAGVAFDQRLLRVPRPARLEDYDRFLPTIIELLTISGIQMDDALRYGGVLLKFATSCRERREQEYDNRSWAEFAHADKYRKKFHELVILASRNLSAMRAKESSAATIGAISLQMIFDFEPSPDRKMDPLLCGPTDETWLQPWFDHLRGAGVHFHFEAALDGFDFDPATTRLRGVRIGGQTRTADYYLCAIPLDCIRPLLSDEMCAAEPALERLRTFAPLAAGNMVGIQYFLRQDAPIVAGHVHYPQTAFALTSISQAQFWRTKPDQRPGTPELKGIISAIISDWETPGTEGLPASAYAERDRLLAEAWRQMASSLPPGALNADDVIAAHLDMNVALDPFRNPTPLLIHPVGQRARRPDARLAIRNLYLASDYVRTNTDLATMEGADEASRRAVRALLTDAGVSAARHPMVWEFSEGPVFDAAKRLDQVLFRHGWRHLMEEPRHRVEEIRKTGHGVFGHALDLADGWIDRLRDHVLPDVDWFDPDRDLLQRWAQWLARR